MTGLGSKLRLNSSKDLADGSTCISATTTTNVIIDEDHPPKAPKLRPQPDPICHM